MAEQQIVVFSLNNELCGVQASQVKQIIKYMEITKVPRMPKYVEGIINLRGSVIPVIDLNKRFELGQTPVNKKTKMLVSDINGQLLGFIVNDVTELMKLAEENVENAPEIIHKAGNQFLKSVGKAGDKLVSILDLSAVLTESEVGNLKENMEKAAE